MFMLRDTCNFVPVVIECIYGWSSLCTLHLSHMAGIERIISHTSDDIHFKRREIVKSQMHFNTNC